MVSPIRAAMVGTEAPEASRRLAKVARNYSMDYVRNMIPVLTELLGPLDAGGLLYRTGRRIGMQYSTAVSNGLGEAPAAILARLLAAHGDRIEITGDVVVQHGWRLMAGLESECVPEWFDGWRGLWEGVVAVIEPGTRLECRERMALGDDAFVWKLRPPRVPARF